MKSPRTQIVPRESDGTPEKRALSAHVLDEIKKLPAKYPQPRSAVMPALDLAQEELGYLTPQAMSEVAAALELDPGYVEGVATFYTLFHLSPIGKYRFYVCTNLSCLLRGADEIVDHVKKSIAVNDPHDVSADGLFSYEEVECLGACEYAPMMRFDHRFHYDLTPEKIDSLIAEAKGERKELLPSRGEVPSKPAERRVRKVTTPSEVPAAAARGGPKAPEGQARKPRALRKKKEPDV